MFVKVIIIIIIIIIVVVVIIIIIIIIIIINLTINDHAKIANNDKAWKVWFDSDAPEDSPIPDGYGSSLDTFRKLLLIRSWCPDRTINQARTYITDSIGKEVCNPLD